MCNGAIGLLAPDCDVIADRSACKIYVAPWLRLVHHKHFYLLIVFFFFVICYFRLILLLV